MKNLLLLVILLVLSTQTQAQRIYYNVIVTEPASVAGTYEAIQAEFGTADWCTGESFTGEWAISEDSLGGTEACDTVMNDLSGKIALIDLGGCLWDIKALNVQNKGAIAAVVCNDDPDEFLWMMATTDFGDDITIPVWMMSYQDCQTLRTEIPLELTFEPGSEGSTDNVLWGGPDNPGQGDFDGGLNGWTVNNISCSGGAPATIDLWQWAPKGNSDAFGPGAYGSDNIILSLSSCNGAMTFNSDHYDNDGIEGNFGFGPCAAVQEGELISPVIDISGFNAAGLSLRFNQNFRQFQSEYYVGWSTDGGSTWTEEEINTEAPVNSLRINNVLRIPLPGVTDSDSLRIKFRMVGNYYFWTVDDVALIEQEAYNLQISNEFYAIPQNHMWPYGQLDPVAFLADVGNVGALAQDNVNLNITITEDAGGTVIYEDDKDYGTIDGNTIIENEPFAFQWIPGPSTTTGSYSGTYAVSSSESDFDDSDNSRSFSFMITDDVFAKEFGFTRDVLPATSNYDAGEAFSWAYGNHYYIANANDMLLKSCSFIVANGDDPDMLNKPVLIWLYTWTDDNADGNADPNERAKVALGTHIIDGTEPSDSIIEVPMATIIGAEDYAFEDNTHYLLMVEYLTDDPIEDDITLSLGSNDELDYSAMVLATEDYFAPRYAGMLGVNGTLEDEPYSSVGFGQDLVPVIRMHVKTTNDTRESLLAGKDLMDIFPNPAKESINVQFKLDQPLADAVLEITDLTGRSLLINQYQMILNDRVSINVSNLKNGIYLAVLRTEEGVQTERFVIQK